MKQLIAIFALSLALLSPASAQNFQRTGKIEFVSLEEQRLTITDIPYQLSDSLVVRSMSGESVSPLRLRSGRMIGFKTSGNNLITEIWLLPSNYESRRGRR